MFDMKNVTEVGIKFPQNITHEEHRAAGKALHTIEQGLQWAIGDWYNAIKWGDHEKECEAAEINYGKARVYAQCASSYDLLKRFNKLSFVHHLRVAAVDEPLRSRLLRNAEANSWSERELVKQKKIALGVPEKPLLPSANIDGRIDAMVESLPKTVSTKVRKDIRDAYHALKKSYDADVRAGVREQLKAQKQRIDAMEKEAEEMRDAAIKMRRGVKAFITDAEYKLVLGCLHTDKEADPKRKAKAFAVMQKLKPVALIA